MSEFIKTLKLRVKDKHASVLGQMAREVKFCGKCSVIKPLADFSNNRSKSDGKAANCKACQASSTAAWREANPGAGERATKNWIAVNRDRFLSRQTAWREDKRPALSAAAVRWARSNPARANARNAKRRAAAALATFGESAEIQMWYEVAEVLSRGGVRFQVDHIVPLISDKVCGLHAPWNMSVLPHWQNASKGNRTWPDASLEAGASA